jgi:hypothetical protein
MKTAASMSSGHLRSEEKSTNAKVRWLQRFFVYALIIGLSWLALWLAIANPTFTPHDASALNPVNSGEIRRHVQALAAAPQANGASREPAAAVLVDAEYIRNEWQAQGYEVHEQTFVKNGVVQRNLIATMEPRQEASDAHKIRDAHKILVIGASYGAADAGHERRRDQSRWIASLLELSRIAKQGPALHRRVQFVAYLDDGGSLEHMKSLKAKDVDVKAMIGLGPAERLDMKVWPLSEKRSPIRGVRLFYPEREDFIAVVGKFGDLRRVRRIKQLMQERSSVDVRSINAPWLVSGASGYPKVLITDTAFMRSRAASANAAAPESIAAAHDTRLAAIINGMYGVIREL